MDRFTGLPVKALRMSIQSAHEGGKAVSLKHLPTFPTKQHTWHSFLLRDAVDSRAKMKQSRFVPATFRIVALCTVVIVTTTNLLNNGLNVLETVEDGYVIFAWNMEQI
jgi:hypothetical protein